MRNICRIYTFCFFFPHSGSQTRLEKSALPAFVLVRSTACSNENPYHSGVSLEGDADVTGGRRFNFIPASILNSNSSGSSSSKPKAKRFGNRRSIRSGCGGFKVTVRITTLSLSSSTFADQERLTHTSAIMYK